MTAHVRQLFVVPGHLGIYDEVLFVFVGRKGILSCYHDFMQLFAGADTDFLDSAAGKHRFCEVGNLKGRDFADKGFAAFCFFEGFNHQLHALLQADPETGHAQVGDRKLCLPVCDELAEKRDNRTAASCNVAVANDREVDVLIADIGVCCDKQLVADELCAAVKVDRVYRFVGGKCNDLFYIGVQGCLDDVHRAVNVGLDRFVRVIFTGGNLF